jgi:hypothetical protein
MTDLLAGSGGEAVESCLIACDASDVEPGGSEGEGDGPIPADSDDGDGQAVVTAIFPSAPAANAA